MAKIVDIIADATKCTEFKDSCNTYMSVNMIPPGVLDFWFYGCRNSKEQYNSNFLIYQMLSLSKLLKKPIKIDPEGTQVSKWEERPEIAKELEPWLMQTKEKENDVSLEVKDYLPNFVDNISCVFQALTSQVGFDMDVFEEEHTFALLPSVQMPANNRDLDLDYCSKENYSGCSDYKMLEYISHQKGTERDVIDRFNLSEAHHILVSCRRREKVEDEKLREVLSPYTTTFDVTSTSSKGRDRHNGAKTVGDLVGVATDFDEVNDLFTLLTVSGFELS